MLVIISNKRRLLELSAVILTAIGKLVFMDYLGWRLPFVAIVMLLWLSYIAYRRRTEPRIMKYWGFRTDNFKKVLIRILPFGLFALVAFIVSGFFLGTMNLSWHIIPILLLYPLWGVVQQFLLIALTAGNLQDMKGQKLNKWIIIFISALFFAAIHYPYTWLIAGTFILALFYGWVYLMERNLYVLGLFHGWLGAIFFYTVVGRDPFLEMFGKF